MASSLELDGMVDAYDEVFVLDNHLTHTWYPQRVIRLASGSSLLELGLGHGHSAAMFAQHFSRYKVIDGSQAMIDRFKSRFQFANIDIVNGYFEDFETDERFDNIGMGFILEHVDDPALVLDRYRSYLRPGGSVFIAVPNSESLHRRLGHEAGMLDDLEHLSAGDINFGHQRYLNMRTLTALVQSCGYFVVATEGLFLKPVTTGQLEKLQLAPEILQAMMKVGIAYPELCNSILMQVKAR